jgi:pimeloyl-ACP methyl ester carboxylesterase
MTEPVLFVPGAFCDRRLFAHQLDHLGDVAAPRFVDLADAASVAAMAEAVLRDAPARFAFVGLSLGGIVGLEILRRAPARVSRLALLATTAEPDPPPVTAVRRASIARVRGGAFAAQVDDVLGFLVAAATRERPAMVASVREMALGVGAARYARQVEAIMNRPDQRAVPPAIGCPTLVICGRDDAVTTAEAHRALAAAIPGARLAIVEQAGHLVPFEQPQATTALLRDWLLYSA